MRLDLFVKVKYESSTIILFVGIRYSMCDSDLLSNLTRELASICIIYSKWCQRYLWHQLAL